MDIDSRTDRNTDTVTLIQSFKDEDCDTDSRIDRNTDTVSYISRVTLPTLTAGLTGTVGTLL